MPANSGSAASCAQGVPRPLVLDCSCQVQRTGSGGMAIIPKCGQHTQDPGKLARHLVAQGMSPSASASPQPTAPTDQDAATAATYTGSPGDTLLDEVRFLLGDTNMKAPYLKDGEIDWLLCDTRGDALSAAIRGCETIIAKLSGARDESVGSVSISFSQSAAGFTRLLKTLQARMGKRALPFAGGINRMQRLKNRCDPTIVRPAFSRDMMQRDRYCGDWGWARGPYGAAGGFCDASFDWTARPSGGFCPPPCPPTLPPATPPTTEPSTPAQQTVGDRLLEGPTDPDENTPGLPGDYYFNTKTNVLFGPYPGSSEVTLPAGVVDTGVRILTGAQDPTDQTAGVAGEYFINQNDDMLFGPYTSPNGGT